jgi:transposase
MEVKNMTYERLKLIDGKEYRYLVKCVWINGKPVQKTMKYLGPADPIYKTGNKRKTNASIFVRMLNNEEKSKIKTATYSGNAFTKERAKIILLSNEGLFAKQIANKLNCEARKVRKAIVAFNQKGLTALERGKAKGAKIVFTELDKKIILIHFSKGPRAFNIAVSYWTLPRLRKHLIDSKVVSSISIETLRQILLSNGAKLTKSKRWQYSPDKNFLRKKEQ